MKLTITDTNFTNSKDWIFKLSDIDSNSYFVMNAEYYKHLDLKSPITKKHLDYFDKGLVIEAQIKTFDDIKVVVSILE
ncbi:MAG: hypothetical protein M3O71_21550 [Bacteroidota bacterium]|nr:hypothetical protein [Bacteroidota bacterium]